jgi:hypothetical protein
MKSRVSVLSAAVAALAFGCSDPVSPHEIVLEGTIISRDARNYFVEGHPHMVIEIKEGQFQTTPCYHWVSYLIDDADIRLPSGKPGTVGSLTVGTRVRAWSTENRPGSSPDIDVCRVVRAATRIMVF